MLSNGLDNMAFDPGPESSGSKEPFEADSVVSRTRYESSPDLAKQSAHHKSLSWENNRQIVFYENEETRPNRNITLDIEPQPEVVNLLHNVEVQTESKPVLLSSWKIIKTSTSSHNRTEEDPSPFISNLYLTETRSMGFNESSQTRYGHLYRQDASRLHAMSTAWHVITILVPVTWYLLVYLLDQVLDILVAVDVCALRRGWYCGLSLTFLVLPSMFLNVYSYDQLTQPDIASVAPVNKWLARALVVLFVAPLYLIGRKVTWCLKAWTRDDLEAPSRRLQGVGGQPPASLSATEPAVSQIPSSRALWAQARMETESTNVKWYQSLLESVPQLSIQSYIVLKHLVGHGYMGFGKEEGSVWVGLVAGSSLISLVSASAGMASVLGAERARDQLTASLAIFLTLGSRVLVCSGVATIHLALWFAPLAASTMVALIAKISESKETTVRGVLIKLHKYTFEAFIMSSLCPPFNVVGFFASVPYVMAGVCFLLLDPNGVVNVCVFVLSILGQIMWLLVGFLVH